MVEGAAGQLGAGARTASDDRFGTSRDGRLHGGVDPGDRRLVDRWSDLAGGVGRRPWPYALSRAARAAVKASAISRYEDPAPRHAELAREDGA